MRFFRATRGIPGKDGEVPWFDEERTVRLGNYDVPATVKRRLVNGQMELKVVRVSRQFKFDDASGHGVYQIEGGADTEEVQRALDEAQAKMAERRGSRVFNGGQDMVTFKYEIPPTTSVAMNSNDAGRFLAKVALGIAFQQWGEPWVVSSYARALRAIVREDADWAVEPIRGELLNILRIRRENLLSRISPFHPIEDEHEIGFVPYADGVYLHIIIFGSIGARFRVNDRGEVGRPCGFGVNYKEKGAVRDLEVVG